MAARKVDRRPHIVVEGSAAAEPFTSPVQGGGKPATVSVNRARHGTALREQLAVAEKELERRRGLVVPVGVEGPKGFYLEFESPSGFDLNFESIENAPSHIELMFVREVADKQFATVYVPEGKLTHFVKRVEDYLAKNTPPSAKAPAGNPRNQALVESIADIRLTVAEGFWTDDPSELPERDAVVYPSVDGRSMPG